MSGQRSRNLQLNDVQAFLELEWLQGRDVSANRIVDALGGSSATAQKFLGVWREQKQLAFEAYAMPPSVVGEAMRMIQGGFELLKVEANTGLRQQLEIHEQERQSWSLREANFESELGGVQRELDGAGERLDGMIEENHQLVAALAESRALVASNLQQQAALERQLVEACEQHNSKEQAFLQDEGRLNVALDAERRAVRAACTDLDEAHKLHQQVLKEHREVSGAKLLVVSSELAELRGQFTSASQQLLDARETLASSTDLLTLLRTQLAAGEVEAAGLRVQAEDALARSDLDRRRIEEDMQSRHSVQMELAQVEVASLAAQLRLQEQLGRRFESENTALNKALRSSADD